MSKRTYYNVKVVGARLSFAVAYKSGNETI